VKPFFILLISNLSLIFLFQYFIDFDALIISALDGDLLEIFLTKQLDLNWKHKFLYPTIFSFLQLTVKTIVISLVIYSGLFFINAAQGIKSLRTVICLVCVAELIFVIEKAVNLVVFMAKPDLTLEFIQQFSPVSLYGFVGKGIGLDYLNYLLKSINLYELAYVFILAFLISDNIGLDFSKSLKATFLSYGSLMACWVIFVTYMILNTSS
jgi:hypothetical protein